MFYMYDKPNLKFNRVSPIIIIAILVIMFFVSFIIAYEIKEIKVISAETRAIVLQEKNEFSRDNLKAYILELNIRFPNIVLAQAEIETGHFTSNLFKENNNLFGMKVATKRPTTNKGEERGHAYYDNWRESVLDYGFFSAQYLSDIKTEKQYLDYLKENYAEDPNYVNKIIKLIDK